jgi:hypothetical protein
MLLVMTCSHALLNLSCPNHLAIRSHQHGWCHFRKFVPVVMLRSVLKISIPREEFDGSTFASHAAMIEKLSGGKEERGLRKKLEPRIER